MRLILACGILLLALPGVAQGTAEVRRYDNDTHVLAPSFSYGGHVPAGDLATRFGPNLTFGVGIEWLSQSNWFFGLHYNYLFGQQVKEDPLSILRDADGNIPGENGEPSFVALRQRGFASGIHVGRLITRSTQARAGLRIEGGIGILQHKIRIQEDPQSFVALVYGEYKKGWDRMANGISLRQFVGWQVLSQNRRINFYAGVEIEEAFTRSRRSYDFAQMRPLREKRFDMLIGLRAGWIMPFYIHENTEEIYY